MARRKVTLARGIAVLALALMAGCAPIARNHGYVPTDEDLAQIVVGADTRETVAQTIGNPSAGGVVDGSGYYYVRSRWETRAWRAPQEIDRQVVAVSFDGNGVVRNVERFSLRDGQIVPLSRRVTDSSIQNVSIIRTIFGNIGRLSADQVLR
jgi:outer membrane protein assembly factor BamE (lipoprotein component of BamABCDE complex)